jgi:Domain of unknown function (DUF4192)
MEPTAMTLTARSPEDVLAMVPVVLGFQPEESLVMLTFGPPGGSRTFHARVDLPRRPRDLDEVIASLVEPAVSNRVARVLLVAYTEDVALAERVTGRVRSAMREHDIDVVGRLVTDGQRWWALPRHGHDPGTPYDVSAHPFAAEAVLHGLVTHGSRARLAETLSPHPAGVRAVERLLTRLEAVGDGRRASEAAWAAGLVRRRLTDRRPARTRDVARLLVGLDDRTVRDAAWLTMSRAEATAAVDFWTDVVRRTPTPHLAAPATILGFAAWLAGHGALAWCALDRSAEADPDYSLALLLADGLAAALPPSAWEAITADEGPGRPA